MSGFAFSSCRTSSDLFTPFFILAIGHFPT